MPAASPRLVPIGVRIPEDVAATLRGIAKAQRSSLGSIVRAAAEAVAHGDAQRELMGVSEAAATLGTTTSNLSKIVGLPEPLYGPKHPDPRYRLRAGSLYDAERIRALAAERRARAAATEGE